MLLSQKSVQEELKLNEEQVKKVDELLAKQRESFGDSRDLSREERQKRFTESREASQKAVGAILNEAQQKRYKQVSLQLQGAGALGDPEVAASLGLSDEQKKSVAEIQSAAREEMRSQFQDGGGDREKFRAARDATNEKLQGLLTPEQKTKWQELAGEPFKGELQAPQRGGEGQRRRRNRDGADARSTSTNVLTADRSNQKGDTAEKANRDKKAEKQRDGDKVKADKPKIDGAKSAKGEKSRKHHGDKHAGKHRGKQSPHDKHARHRQGDDQRGPQARRGHGPEGPRQEHIRDARSQAWERVAHAVSRGDGPRSLSHRTGHRQHGRHDFARQDGRHSFVHHGRPSFHGPRPHGRSFDERERHAHHGPRHHFAGHHGPRHHRGPQLGYSPAWAGHRQGGLRPHGFAHQGPRRPGGNVRQHAPHHRGVQPGDFQRFAGDDRYPQHGGRPGHAPNGHRGLEPRSGGPGDRDGARFHHVSETPRWHGPPVMHGDHHRHHRAHFAGFQRAKDAERSHGEHRHHPQREGEKQGAKHKHRDGRGDIEPVEAKGVGAKPKDDKD
jgi:hypothetical protein